MNKKKIIIIVLSIILVISAIVGSTYSLFYSESTASNPESYSTGLLSIIANSKSDTISLSSALPITDEEGKISTPYTFTIKNIGNLDYQFDIKLLSTSDNTISPQYIKLQIDDGEITTLSELSNSTIKSNIILKAKESIDISIRVWLSIDTPNTEIGKIFNSKIVADGQAIYTNTNYSVTAADYITNLYSNTSKTVVTNNDIEYNYATEVSLMNDRLGGTTEDYNGGNIRYYGANPNNYVYFNCDNYNNQTSSTCELWRIIGVFDGKLKLIRNDSIGGYSWDTSVSDVNNGYGINDWGQADIMKLLNPGYESEGIGGSLYYNAKSGKCYSGRNNSTTSCNFTNSGLKNDITRNMIATVLWNLGAADTAEIFTNELYQYEIGKNVYPNNSTYWDGKIALLYGSDYGYATDFKKCSFNFRSYSSNSSLCNNNVWLYYAKNYEYLINSNSSLGSLVYYKSVSGNLYQGDNGGAGMTYGQMDIRPSLFLNSDVEIVSGEGSSSNPYLLK